VGSGEQEAGSTGDWGHWERVTVGGSGDARRQRVQWGAVVVGTVGYSELQRGR
jgi:hypothetical protein